jgi:hypothetical protein
MGTMRMANAARLSCAVLAAAWCGAAAAQGLKPPADEKPFTLGGFYEFTGAYTYADPSHWSRAVNRFQLSAKGNLGANAKWTIGGRVDLDPVYASNDFYLSDVRNDQKRDALWRETYVDFSAAGWDFRVGAQNIVWGEVVALFVADVVSARDLRDFVLPSFDVIRKPQWAARAEYFWGDSHLELVWIPVATFDDIGKPGADFYPAPLPSPTSGTDAAQFLDPVRPARNLSNSNYGLRANTLVDGWDLAAFYYRSTSVAPTFYRIPGVTPGSSAVFQPRYDRFWQTGGTVSKDFGEFVARAEVVYGGSRDYEATDLAAPEGVVERKTLDWIVSADFTVFGDGRLNLQGFQRLYLNGGSDAVALKSGDFGASIQLTKKVTPTIEPEILWVQTFGGGGSMVRPRLNWYPIRNTKVSVGADIFTGDIDGLFGRYNNRDRVYTEVRYSF